MVFITEKQQKAILNFPLNSLNEIEKNNGRSKSIEFN